MQSGRWFRRYFLAKRQHKNNLSLIRICRALWRPVNFKFKYASRAVKLRCICWAINFIGEGPLRNCLRLSQKPACKQKQVQDVPCNTGSNPVCRYVRKYCLLKKWSWQRKLTRDYRTLYPTSGRIRALYFSQWSERFPLNSHFVRGALLMLKRETGNIRILLSFTSYHIRSFSEVFSHFLFSCSRLRLILPSTRLHPAAFDHFNITLKGH